MEISPDDLPGSSVARDSKGRACLCGRNGIDAAADSNVRGLGVVAAYQIRDRLSHAGESYVIFGRTGDVGECEASFDRVSRMLLANVDTAEGFVNMQMHYVGGALFEVVARSPGADAPGCMEPVLDPDTGTLALPNVAVNGRTFGATLLEADTDLFQVVDIDPMGGESLLR
jgi:hypothetical protein